MRAKVLSHHAYNQLLKDREKLVRLETQAAMLPFVNEFLHVLGTLLAHTPRSQWPAMAVTAFHHAEQKVPTGAALYKAEHEASHK